MPRAFKICPDCRLYVNDELQKQSYFSCGGLRSPTFPSLENKIQLHTKFGKKSSGLTDTK